MKRRETEERIRLLEYENALLQDKVSQLIKHNKVPIMPKCPFARIEKHGLGVYWSIPTYNQLREKYRPIS